ncbi:MAG: asparagine synthase (glutamine-hydrolyzing) [Candidatus Fischerbacteria bacterium RBG_13_37_8]|uniref:asparagine synthase (glutamine-hydrolyzing) n=1 Tax=Candidatus Fischerbacteria bacterium RBG_13_37_8 TaxID=1817863 RepID=A0A1F5VDY4_9BACT|nr:MAG: asparagine synthase (glutamine-hydrolyzing) [Candidatus Fischerbacteria bacterium RBG_13_37_8]
MCGICGYCGKNILHNKEIIDQMTATLIHRGPDERGIYNNKDVALGARRLSIIDLARGSQPVANENKTIWVAYNGEIYNFHHIREELLARGHIFTSGSDTEVIVHSYEEWGEDFVKKFRGMFAFALWDSTKEALFLARDRIGIKPLYYTLLPDFTIVFGSEIKAILKYPGISKNIEPKALDCFLTLEYIICPLSIFKNIHKLEPGHLLKYHNGEISIKSYWDLIEATQVNQEIHGMSNSAIQEKLAALLQESVKYRLISDVPLGAFLSGGIDSSSVVAMMHLEGIHPVRTFSIGFSEQSYNELAYARKIARLFSTEHHEEIIEPDAVDLVNSLIYYLDEPLGDYSIFPTYLVSKMARKHVTVVLSGDGGDELFAGYEHYKAQKLSKLYNAFPGVIRKHFIESIIDGISPSPKKKGLVNLCKRFIDGVKKSPFLHHYRWTVFLNELEKQQLYTEEFKAELGEFSFFDLIEPHLEKASHFDAINAELYMDIKTYLADDILVKVDRMSMATSLEARVPLLDHFFVEWAMSLNGTLKLHNFTSKWILKKTMEHYLPKDIIYRRKEGFSIPIKNWLKTDLRDLMEATLSKENVNGDAYFNYACIDKLKKEHLSGHFDHSHKLWALIVFYLWKKQFLG